MHLYYPVSEFPSLLYQPKPIHQNPGQTMLFGMGYLHNLKYQLEKAMFELPHQICLLWSLLKPKFLLLHNHQQILLDSFDLLKGY